MKISAVRWILAALGALCALFFASPMLIGVRNVGNIFAMCFFLFLVAVTLFWHKLRDFRRTKTGRIVFAAVCVLLGICTAYAVLLSSLMLSAALNAPDDAKTMIVLGCQVKKSGDVSLMLGNRLDAAYDYLTAHPDCKCVLSGGQGGAEPVSEAEAMRDYLVNLGIDEARLFTEDKSSSTDENIRFSLDVIRENGIDESDIAIVTDGFHQYRASLFARRYGLEASAVCADTPLWLLPTYWVREWFGISAVYVNADQALSASTLH